MKLLRNMITILLQFVIYVVFLVYLLVDIFVTCAKYNQMKGLKVTVVGDAKQVRNGLSAIYEGYMAGYNA